MVFYVYILISEVDKSYYKGFTTSPKERLLQHNLGLSHYTSSKTPWRLVYLEEFSDKRSALVRERSLKKYGHAQIELLINSEKNIRDRYPLL